jgi:hypothetical protein
MSAVQGEAAAAILSMVQDLIARDHQQEIASQLPVTNQDISMKDGACFDVATYYIGAAGGTAEYPDWLKQANHNGVNMLEKTSGSKTLLTTEPIVFNGVKLPKGALFKRTSDGYAVLRLTPFSFDNPVDQLASGSEVTKAVVQQRIALQKVGGYTLDKLLESATK